jgi:hypothetical protein
MSEKFSQPAKRRNKFCKQKLFALKIKQRKKTLSFEVIKKPFLNIA